MVGEKSLNPVKSSSYKNFVPVIPFKIKVLIQKKYYGNECLDLAWDRIKVSQIGSFITTNEKKKEYSTI